MEEELIPQQEMEVNTQTITSVEPKTETKLDNLPRIEDLIKSEKQVKTAPNIEGVTEAKTDAKDRVFSRKEDNTKKIIRKRLKIVTAVYLSIATMLLGLVGASAVTLALLNKDISTNVDTIQKQTDILNGQQAPNFASEGEEIFVTLNEPRDYTDDKKELSFMDKLSILFRNLFG